MLKAISLKWLYIHLKTAHTHTHILMCGYTCKGIRHLAVYRCPHILSHIHTHCGCCRRGCRCCHTRTYATPHIWMNSVCWIKIFEQKSQQQRRKKEFYSFLLFVYFILCVERLLCTLHWHTRTHAHCFDIYDCWRVYFTILLYCCQANLMYGRKPQETMKTNIKSHKFYQMCARMYLLQPYLFRYIDDWMREHS